jgi:hypothetical protein
MSFGLPSMSYPEHKPKEEGYYYTKYWNIEQSEIYYKSFWWNGKEFGGWRLPIDNHVKEFYQDTHDLYYCPSMMKAERKR